MSETLEQVLSDEPSEPKAETPEKEVPEEPKESTDVKSEAPTKVEKSGSSPDEQLTAMKAELARIREKNRDLEQKLKEPEKVPDLFEDPDGRLKYLEQTFDSKLEKTRLSISEEYAKDRYGEDEYNEKLNVFMSLVEQSPSLVVDMKNAPNPAKFAYDTARKHMLIEQIDDIDKMKANIKAETEKEVEARLRKEYGKTLPTSLSDTRATSGHTDPVGNESLEDVIGIDAIHRSG